MTLGRVPHRPAGRRPCWLSSARRRAHVVLAEVVGSTTTRCSAARPGPAAVRKPTPANVLTQCYGHELGMEATPFVAVLSDAIAQAGRRGGGLRIEQLHDGWETSIAVDRRRIAITRDEYLE